MGFLSVISGGSVPRMPDRISTCTSASVLSLRYFSSSCCRRIGYMPANEDDDLTGKLRLCRKGILAYHGWMRTTRATLWLVRQVVRKSFASRSQVALHTLCLTEGGDIWLSPNHHAIIGYSSSTVTLLLFSCRSHSVATISEAFAKP